MGYSRPTISFKSPYRDVRRAGAVGMGGNRRTECPRLSGWISRKASVLSLSKSFMEGISPGQGVSQMTRLALEDGDTLDDFAENTGRCHGRCD